MAGTEAPVEVGRFYTRSRKIPLMVGRFHDGSRIPGGPYTLGQGVLGASTGFALFAGWQWWSTGAGVVDLLLAAAVCAGVTWGSGFLPSTTRNPLTAAWDAGRAMAGLRAGTCAGRPATVARPHQCGPWARRPVPTGSVTTGPMEAEPVAQRPVITPTPVSTDEQAGPRSPARSPGAPAVPGMPGVCAVQHLLACSRPTGAPSAPSPSTLEL